MDKFFLSSSKNNSRTNDSARKIATGQEHYYNTGYLLDHNYF